MLVIITLLFLFSQTFICVSALEVDSTYSDVSSTSTIAINLVNYANSYDDFITSDFVIFQDSQYSYYIVWSDNITYSSSVFTASDIEYIHYYRGTSSSSTYSYVYGSDTSFNLTSDYICTTNVIGAGFTSSNFETYNSIYNNTLFNVLFGSFLFALLLNNLRKE